MKDATALDYYTSDTYFEGDTYLDAHEYPDIADTDKDIADETPLTPPDATDGIVITDPTGFEYNPSVGDVKASMGITDKDPDIVLRSINLSEYTTQKTNVLKALSNSVIDSQSLSNLTLNLTLE